MTCFRPCICLVALLLVGTAAAQDGPPTTSPATPPVNIISDLVTETGAAPGHGPITEAITTQPLPPAPPPTPQPDLADRVDTFAPRTGSPTEQLTDIFPEMVDIEATETARPGTTEHADSGPDVKLDPDRAEAERSGTASDRGSDRGSGHEAVSGPDSEMGSETDWSPEIAPGHGSDSVRSLLSGLWRVAVSDGRTTLGFEDWLAETLGQQIAEAPEPLPVFPDDQEGRIRAISERWLARAGPVALGEAGRVVTVFGASIPTAFCSPFLACVIELEPGEVLTDTPSWGDSVRWQVTFKQQGQATVILEVKPAEDADVTNLVIPTDRRIYTIRLVNDLAVHTPILSFSYPDTIARVASAAIAARDAEAQATARAKAEAAAQAGAVRQAELDRAGLETDRGRVSAAELDFGFRFDGGRDVSFRPVRVFADGRRTYIDLHPSYRGTLPVIIAGPEEANKALNTRVMQGGSRLVADRVISDIWLQAGEKRIRIRRATR